jgi:dihydroxyacetone kinase-like protein
LTVSGLGCGCFLERGVVAVTMPSSVDRPRAMKKFINDPADVVDEMFEGFVHAHRQLVRPLQDARVLVRARPADKVALVTGGGSGHKPAFIGYVGEGMLDAVVVGDIFTSPPAAGVLSAIHAVNRGKGVLLLLGNYSGDVMNFEMAAEMARDEGIEVEMAIATDDVGAGFHDTPEMRRGVVGQFLIWKACGAAAEKGANLAQSKAIAERVNAGTRTMGVAIAPCTVPAAGRPTFTLADDAMEVGVGHHGEPGTSTEPLVPVDALVDRLVEQIVSDLPYRAGDEVVTLINGLGATPQLELYIALRRLARNLEERSIAIYRSLVGEYFTALEMAGFSITLLKLDDELKDLLDAPAMTPCFVQR